MSAAVSARVPTEKGQGGTMTNAARQTDTVRRSARLGLASYFGVVTVLSAALEGTSSATPKGTG